MVLAAGVVLARVRARHDGYADKMVHRTEDSGSMSMRRGGNPVKGLIARPGEVHPVVGATIFSHQFNTSGGATMGVHTNAVEKPHAPGYIVGGQQDDKGKQIPTVYDPHPQHAQRLDTILGHRDRIRGLASDRHAGMGYWTDTETPNQAVEVDASSVFRDRRHAVAVGRRRGEKAVWDLGKMRDIRLDH